MVSNMLNFHFNFNKLEKKSNEVIALVQNNQLELRINELNGISERLNISTIGARADDSSIKNIFEKFKKFFNYDHKTTTFERRELRTLSYTLSYSEYDKHSIFSNEEELIFALDLLSKKWTDSFLFGLIHCLLENWEKKTCHV